MNVIDVGCMIAIVANEVFPIAPLLYTAFPLGLPASDNTFHRS